MCGIIGYTGPLEASKILLEGLAGLEYRGYDSAGIALCMEDSRICLAKKTGKIIAINKSQTLPTVESDIPVGLLMEV